MIPIHDISLNYEVSGNGAALILIGGLTANANEWSQMKDDLSQKFTVYMPENRGSGKTTGWTTDFTIAQMADDIAVLIEHLGLDKAYVVGHSMGGAIAQELAIRHPERVKALILASSFAYFPKAAQLYIENTSALFGAGLNAELVLRTIFTRLYSSEFLDQETKIGAEIQRMRYEPVPQTPAGYQAQVQALKSFDTRAELNKIQCPCLIINGHEDILTPAYLSDELHHGIKNSILKIIPNCGHMIPHEKPEAFRQAILSFFMDN